MRIRATLLGAAVLAMTPAVASAQEDADGPVAAPTPAPELCDRGPGTDADYAGCDTEDLCDRPIGDGDGDYAYCPTSSGEPIPSDGAAPKRRTAAAQPLPAGTLPVTGSETLLLALLGVGFLLAGAGLRLQLNAGDRPPSA